MRFKRLVSRIYDLPNAFRVLDIMDEAGCDIERVEFSNDKWKIIPKWYVSGQEARDLQKIILFKRQYKNRSPVWTRFVFRNCNSGYRPFSCWFK